MYILILCFVSWSGGKIRIYGIVVAHKLCTVLSFDCGVQNLQYFKVAPGFSNQTHLKGRWQEFFDPRFFHQSTPPRAPIFGLKLFRICIVSTGSMTPQKPNMKSRIPQLLFLSMTMRKPFKQRQWSHDKSIKIQSTGYLKGQYVRLFASYFFVS